MFKNSSFLYDLKKQRKAAKKARERYQGLSEEKKNKRQQSGCQPYKIFAEDEKQILVEKNILKKYNTNKERMVFAKINLKCHI